MEVIDGAIWSRVAEASRGECTFGPAIGDACKVPINTLGGCISIELVTNVNEMLHRCDVDVIDRREVKNDGFQDGPIGMIWCWPATSRSRIVPWAVTQTRIRKLVGAAGLSEDHIHHVIKVMVRVRVIIALREAVDKDAWVWCLHIDLWIRAITMFNGEEDVASAFVWIVAIESTVMVVVIDDVVTDHRMHPDFAKEATFGFKNAEKEDGGGYADGGIDTVVNS